MMNDKHANRTFIYGANETATRSSRPDHLNEHLNKRTKTDTSFSLTGQLTARSHIIHSQPASILIEICTNNHVEYIINEMQKTFLDLNNLVVGRFYEFLTLSEDLVKLKVDTVKCYRFTDNTTWNEVESISEIYQSPSLSEFSNISGMVTEIDNELGICYINESVMVLVSPCSRIALHFMPKVGQEVIIFNCHRINLGHGKVVFALCAKSYISLKGHDERRVPPLNLSPLLQTLGHTVRDFRLLLWLQECAATLLKSLNNDFLITEGISLQSCDKLRSSVLQSIAKFTIKRITPSKVSLLEEFVSPNHKLYCGTLREEVTPSPLLSLLDICAETTNLENEFDEKGCPISWQYDVKKDQARILVGLISVRHANHRLCLSDAFNSVVCLVLPAEGQNMIADNLVDFNKCVVLVWDHDVIREKFCWVSANSVGQIFSLNYRSISIYCDKTIKCYYANNLPSGNISSVECRNYSRGKLTEDDNRGSDQASAILAEVGRGKCLTPPKDFPLQHFVSQYIIVQMKSSIFAPIFEGISKKPARSYILASLLGKQTSSISLTSRGNDASKSIFLCLERSLLPLQHYLSVNTVYEIRLPQKYDKLFQSRVPLSYAEGLKNMLPTINCVTLPSCCEFYTVPDSPIPRGSLTYQDCYCINEALTEANPKEFINITGYVVGRYHQDPRFDREKISSKANGFGVPDNKVIAIILRDTPPESQTGTPATLYMTYWSTLQYPIGIVPGAKVVFRFVMKIVPRQGSQTASPYFRSSIFTSVEILELVKSEKRDINQSTKDLWGPRSLLYCSVSKVVVGCQWLSVSMTQLLRVSLSSKCTSCEHPVVNAKCSFVGCSASELTVFSQASFMLHEFELPSALVFVPHALVPKLFQSSELWNMVLTLTKKQGQLMYNRTASSQVLSQLSLEDKVFRTLCMSSMKGQRYHLLCREFHKKSNRSSCDLPVFYAIDLSPVSLLMASS